MITRSLPLTLLVLAGLLTADAEAGTNDTPPQSAENVILQNCAVEYKQSTYLGAATAGVLQECLVQPGDRVQAGQLLARLRDQDLRAAIELRNAELQNDLDLRVSEVRYNQAMTKLRTVESLHRRQYASAEESELAKLETSLAAMAVEEAKQKRKLAEISMRQVQAQLQEREFRSPHDGVIALVARKVGELVDPSTTRGLFRIDNLDRLRVTGQVDVVDLWRVKPGQPVRVSVEIGGADLAVESEIFSGQVVFVETTVTPGSQTCMVVAEIDNKDQKLRSGLIARMEIVTRDSTKDKPVEVPAARPRVTPPPSASPSPSPSPAAQPRTPSPPPAGAGR